MRCPYCGRAESRVVDTTSRVVDTTSHLSGDEIRRRRECLECHRRYSTVERVQVRLPLVVKDGPEGMPQRREPFDPEKLRQGVHIACAKRPIAQAAIDRLVETIEASLEESNLAEVSSRTIGEWVIAGLRELDEVAYLRYAIVFLGLDDLASVREELDRLLTEKASPRSPI